MNGFNSFINFAKTSNYNCCAPSPSASTAKAHKARSREREVMADILAAIRERRP
ncbi:MAG: hypothetical protein AAB380_01925 [Verrucomicrobiota bacterium]|mgnify:CR=1 FL=1